MLVKNCSLYNKQKNTRVLGNTRFISRVEHVMFNTRNKSGISAHPCIILHIYIFYTNVCIEKENVTSHT